MKLIRKKHFFVKIFVAQIPRTVLWDGCETYYHNLNSKGWLTKRLRVAVFNNLNSRGRSTIKLVMEEAKSVTSKHDSFMKCKSPIESIYISLYSVYVVGPLLGL